MAQRFPHPSSGRVLDHRRGQHYDIYHFKIKGGSPVLNHAFVTGGRGSRIVNAITGDSYCSFHTVGSVYEADYFRVRICGAFPKRNMLCDLYYDTPREYETHFQTTLSDETKKAWYESHRQVSNLDALELNVDLGKHEAAAIAGGAAAIASTLVRSETLNAPFSF